MAERGRRPGRPGSAGGTPRPARPARPSRPTRPVVKDPSRRAAFEVLKAVRVEDAYANLVLPAVVAHYELSPRDAGFTTELAAGTLRRRGTYDAVLTACLDRKLAKVEAKVLDALRLGTHQLLSMRVPAHAAISTTVDLVREIGNPGAAGFVNAVLRRVSERDLDAWLDQLAPGGSPAALAVRHSHPAWVVEELGRALGETRVHELPALLAADNEAPSVTLVARPGRSTRAELPGEATRWSAYGVVLESGSPAAVRAIAQGRAGVQDEGSQLVAHALATAPLEGRDERWVDLCAGPGGKAALLAALAAERGAGLLAVERQQHRSKLVARALAGADGVLGVVTADGTQAPIAPGSIDRILVDAPCTGLGALRRRPEARWRRRSADLLPLVLLQRTLLDAALTLVRPGGLVLYATCSPVRSETADVVTSALQRHPGTALADVRRVLADVPDCDGPLEGTVQLWPHRHGTDAMFAALLAREA